MDKKEPSKEATRKRRQRAQRLTRITKSPASEWSDGDCMVVLSRPRFKKTPMGQQAWERLGELRGWC